MTNDPGPASLDDRRALTTALGTWGSSVRLADSTADDVFAAIVATPAPELPAPHRLRPADPLSAGWWRDHSAAVAHTAVASARWMPAA